MRTVEGRRAGGRAGGEVSKSQNPVKGAEAEPQAGEEDSTWSAPGSRVGNVLNVQVRGDGSQAPRLLAGHQFVITVHQFRKAGGAGSLVL